MSTTSSSLALNAWRNASSAGPGLAFQRPDLLGEVSGRLIYTAEFRLALEAISDDSTRVDVRTDGAKVYNGRVFGRGPCGFGWFHRSDPVRPTTIEEYTILRHIGHSVGLTNMPELLVPTSP